MRMHVCTCSNCSAMQKVIIMLERAEELKKKLNAIFVAEYEEVMS